ncbi:hypothetical protein [Mycobacterium sp.]|uniref:hypothetical protein n=1 Tax=Mycobacterium sp. TaxID=1785 RepID=UPI0031CE47A8
MPDMVLSKELEREHLEIDSGIEAFIETLDGGTLLPGPLTAALDALRRHIFLTFRTSRTRFSSPILRPR